VKWCTASGLLCRRSAGVLKLPDCVPSAWSLILLDIKGEVGVPRVARLADRAWGGWRRVGDVPSLELEYAVGAGRKVYLESKGIETKQVSELGGRVDWGGIRAEPKVWTKVGWNMG